MPNLWDRFWEWRREREIAHYENAPARDAARQLRSDARAQRRRPQGSGREANYDRGDTHRY